MNNVDNTLKELKIDFDIFIENRYESHELYEDKIFIKLEKKFFKLCNTLIGDEKISKKYIEKLLSKHYEMLMIEGQRLYKIAFVKGILFAQLEEGNISAVSKEESEYFAKCLKEDMILPVSDKSHFYESDPVFIKYEKEFLDLYNLIENCKSISSKKLKRILVLHDKAINYESRRLYAIGMNDGIEFVKLTDQKNISFA